MSKLQIEVPDELIPRLVRGIEEFWNTSPSKNETDVLFLQRVIKDKLSEPLIKFDGMVAAKTAETQAVSQTKIETDAIKADVVVEGLIVEEGVTP